MVSRRRRVLFDEEDDALLVQYIASRSAQNSLRKAKLLFKDFHELVKDTVTWPRAARHPITSWVTRYQSRRDWFHEEVQALRENVQVQVQHGHPSLPQLCEDAASDTSEDPLDLLKGGNSVTSTVKFKRDTQSRGNSAPLRTWSVSSAEAPPPASASALELSRQFGFEVKDILFITKMLKGDIPQTIKILTVMKKAVEANLQLLLSAPMTP